MLIGQRLDSAIGFAGFATLLGELGLQLRIGAGSSCAGALQTRAPLEASLPFLRSEIALHIGQPLTAAAVEAYTAPPASGFAVHSLNCSRTRRRHSFSLL